MEHDPCVSNFKFVSSFNYKTALTPSFLLSGWIWETTEKGNRRKVPPTATESLCQNEKWRMMEKGRDLCLMRNMNSSKKKEKKKEKRETWLLLLTMNVMTSKYSSFLFFIFDLNNAMTVTNHTTCLYSELWLVRGREKLWIHNITTYNLLHRKIVIKIIWFAWS